MQKNSETEILFKNDVINKSQLKGLMALAFQKYGTVKSSIIADRIKNLTFHYATRSGISISIEDLRVPYKKKQLIGLTSNEVNATEEKYGIGNITNVERFQKVIDIWNNTSNSLKNEVVAYFRESDPLNSLYIMAFSGARGNISQVRQLVGMRGLMADPGGQIIDLPIKSNFREGLTVTEYIISSYGARKGLVDTALRTADSGYLTRRLVDVAQDIIVRESDCQTLEGLSKADMVGISDQAFKNRIVGRLIASDFISTSTNLRISRNTEITDEICNQLTSNDLDQIKVRSPLTCESIRSICRNCYGWHLAYSKIVDLGEAIGIIAAQSIGEPGTQLTMRTFHTGGVFSGDLTQQIRAPFNGVVSYDSDVNATLIRTLHGERAFNVRKDILLTIKNLNGILISFKIPKNATLLVNDGEKIYRHQILGEIKKEASVLFEEDRKDVYTDISGEVHFKNLKVEENIDKQGSVTKVNKKAGLIWILYGERYALAPSVELKMKVGQKFLPNENIFAQKQVINKYPGFVKFNGSNEVSVLAFSTIIKNATIRTQPNSSESSKLLEFSENIKFHLKVADGEPLINGQTIGVLSEDAYKTETGGFITYNLEKNTGVKKKKNVEKIFTGYLYWVPEETHQLKSPLSSADLKFSSGSIVKRGTEILPNIFSKVGGLLQLDSMGQEITIKPGELFELNTTDLNGFDLTNRFVKAGEILFPNVISKELVFAEFLEIKGSTYLLARPVQIFKIPRELGFSLNTSIFPKTSKQKIKLKIVKRIFYKNWERFKSIDGVSLLQTFLITDIEGELKNLQPKIEFVSSSKSLDENCLLKLSFYEVFKFEDKTNRTSENIRKSIKLLSHQNQYVLANTVLAQEEVFFNMSGTLITSNRVKNKKEFLILRDSNIQKISYDSSKDLKVTLGELVRIGAPLWGSFKSPYSGQVHAIDNNYIYIRLGRPYLITEGALLLVDEGSLVQRSDILATLVYEKLKTVDIVQGLPKVEEILEARKIKNSCLLAPCSGKVYLKDNTVIESIDNAGNSISVPITVGTRVSFSNGDYINLGEPLTSGPINPFEKLDTLFNYYKNKLPVHEACKQSFKSLQLFLVNEIQHTYLSQGVQIADKHIEVIVKQMTSKVRVGENGDTTLLPGEILNINRAEEITKSCLLIGEEPPYYYPILLGITKASLNSDSFISAASFQETTRVLTEAAIEGKKDWLHGLKENVIIGRLIPAGTGFSSYIKTKENGKKRLHLTLKKRIKDVKSEILFSRVNKNL